MQTSKEKNLNLPCYCGSDHTFSHCCQAYIQGLKAPATPEALMRSRYSAYAIGEFSYILNTYAKTQRQHLSVPALEKDTGTTQWLKLEVLNTKHLSSQVEFCAYYRVESQYYALHELSNFCLEQGQWRYVDGNIMKDSGPFKPKRNDSCLCDSGKKFKKCCGA